MVDSSNLDYQAITRLAFGLACLGALYFILEPHLVNPTLEPGPDFENSESNNTIFDINQGNVSGSLHDIYYQIKVGNTIIPVMISSLGNSVSNLNYDSEAKSIILVISSLNAKADTLIIDIPRIILDSKINGNDKNFTVTVDDQPARFLELKNSIEEKPISHSMTDNISAIQYSNNTESRKLMVEFEQNTKIIKISGTDTIISHEKNISTVEDNSRVYIPILVDSKNENLSLQLSGGTLNYAQLTLNSEDNRTLFLSISPYSSNGNLIIDIPRIILDSKINGNDKNFTVTVDDQPARFLELKNSIEEKPISHSMTDNISAIQYSNNTESRKLMVEFEQNTKIIKISGTDTIISTNQAEDDDTRNTMILRENEDVINMLFPIISLIAVLSGILLYFYLRKNKIYLMKKFKSK